MYLVHMHGRPGNAPLGTTEAGRLIFHASHDGGKTWEQRAVVGKLIDRPWITVDTTEGDYRGKLYCIGQIEKPVILTSSDRGKTVSPTPTSVTADELVVCRPANPIVLPDGTVLFVYEDSHVVDVQQGEPWPRPQISTLRSTDGSQSVAPSTAVNTKWWHDVIQSSDESIATLDFPQLAADPGRSRLSGRLYCVWADGNDADSQRIFFCASPDGGTTWEQPVVLSEQLMNESEETYGCFIPSIAVNKDGVIAVSWYDRRGLPRATEERVEIDVGGQTVSATKRTWHGWNLRLRVSLDGGQTWLPSVQLNEEPSQGMVNIGHTAGLAAAADGRFHATWIDDRTGEKQLWSTAVEVKPESRQSGRMP